MPAPYTVYPEYNFFSICHYISSISGTEFHTVSHKPQLNFINRYLIEEGAKSVICEHEYVEKFYLEDYAEYVVRCFNEYGRKTSRLHFFSETFDEQDFTSYLCGELSEIECSSNKNFVDILKDSYLGYIVVRPIPNTFIAITAFRPPKGFLNSEAGNKAKIIYKKNKVHLFGIDLFVKSIPFQEQDRVVAVCATAALWSFYSSPEFSLSKVPSPSEITNKATSSKQGEKRKLPTDGLDQSMMLESISAMGLAPISLSLLDYYAAADNKYNNIDIEPDTYVTNHLKEIVHAYVSGGFPVLLGLQVFEKNEIQADLVNTKKIDTYHCIGRHAVSIFGFTVDDTIDKQLISHNIKSIILHDDQLGPYVDVEIYKDNYEVIDGAKKCGDISVLKGSHNLYLRFPLEKSILEDIDSKVLPNRCGRVYYPESMILGLHPKIRIPYSIIKKTCTVYGDSFSDVVKLYKEGELADFGLQSKQLNWDIRISTVNRLKREILSEEYIVGDRAALLARSWPKYIWIATGFSSENKLFTALFDSTDIEQGSVYMETIFYDDDYKIFVNTVLHKVLHIADEKLKEVFDDNSIAMFDEFNKNTETHYDFLNRQYGFSKPPAYYNPKEIIAGKQVVQTNAVIIRELSHNFIIESDKEYIWAICEEGFLHIGQDIEVKDKNGDTGKLGHPSLTQNMWARIAGEIKLNDGFLELNDSSGRFCKKYINNKKAQLLNASKVFELYFPDYKNKVNIDYQYCD